MTITIIKSAIKKHDKEISQRNTRYLVNKLLAQLPFAWQKKLAAAPLFPKMAVKRCYQCFLLHKGQLRSDLIRQKFNVFLFAN